MTTQTTTYVSPANTAKYVRAALKKNFPGVKFGVRTHVYSGGASINVNWTDGPVASEVEPVAKAFAGGRFDGSIDLAYSVTHYLRPDGEVLIARNPGTAASGGYAEGEDNTFIEPHLPDGTVKVRFGADFIFCTREITNAPEKIAETVEWIKQNCVVEDGRFGGRWVDDLARSLVYSAAEGDTIAETFKKFYTY